jgi:hypothetical protein
MNLYTLNRLTERFAELDLTEIEKQWVVDEVTALQNVLMDPRPVGYSATSLHSQHQIGYLVGAMNMKDREERLDLLEILLGFSLYYDESVDDFPGQVILGEGPKRSSKDVRISKYMHSRLLEYFLNDKDANKLKRLLGFAEAESQAA